MIIVSGRIYVDPDGREAYVNASLDAVRQARQAHGCLDFVVAGDPLEPDRVNVYEEWESAADVETFRGDDPGPQLAVQIRRMDVARHEISWSGPP